MAEPRARKQAMAMKQTLIEQLINMRDVEKAARETFKVRAYTGIIAQLEAFDGPLNSMADVDAAGFKGLGKGIRGKMEQIFATGVIDKVEEKRELMEAVKELTSVHGIGPVKANELIANGIKTVAELARRLDLLNEVQVKGMRYYVDMLKRIPRKEMDKHLAAIRGAVTPGAVFEIAGSYRRGAESSGDIDVILKAEGPAEQQALIARLKASGYIAEQLASGEHKFMGVCKLSRHKTFRRIDIMWMEPTKYPFALLYFTGSKEFNVRLRTHALQLGYSLNEYGLVPLPGDKRGAAAAPPPVPGDLQTERDVLAFLGGWEAYLDPRKR